MESDMSATRIRFVERAAVQPRAPDLLGRVERLEQEVKTLLSQLRSLTLDYEAGKLFREESNWLYDVAEPNFYFNNVYHVELLDGGARKRWVDQTGRISHSVYLPRQKPYQFAINIVEFIDDSYAQSLRLNVDGQPIEWISTEGNVFQAVIPPLLQAFKIDFEVYIDRKVLFADKSVSFSFSRIFIDRA